MRNSRRFAAVTALVLIGALAGACTPIDGVRVRGWPQLEVIEHHVSQREMRDRCMQYVRFGPSPEACAEFNFIAGRCDIWLSADFPPPAYVLEHERSHCQGYEHAGETELREILARHVSRNALQGRSSQGASAPRYPSAVTAASR